MLAYLDCLHKETGKNHFWRVAALYGDRVTPRIRNGRVKTALCRVYGVAALIRRPRYAAYTECGRVYSGAAQLGRAYGRLYTAAYSRARPVSIEPRILGWPGRYVLGSL